MRVARAVHQAKYANLVAGEGVIMTATGPDRGRRPGPARPVPARTAWRAGAADRADRPARPAVARPGPSPGPGQRNPARIIALAVTGMLVLVTASVARIAHVGASAMSPALTWTLSPATNTVTIRLTSGSGPSGRQIRARSRLVVSRDGQLAGRSPDGGVVRVPVPPGKQTSLVVQVTGPRPIRQAFTVTVPPALRVLASRRSPGGVLLSLSSPLRRPRGALCGADEVSSPKASEVAVAPSPIPCRARLTLTDADGERAVVPVTIPALPETPVYSFAHSAGRAIYITVDDGWTPSQQVLAIMRKTRLPVTAFLIEHAAQQHLAYWRAFVAAGGIVGDHTVSHPNLTKLTLPQATTQWAQARQAFGHMLGQTPVLGRPPYGAFDRTVQAAAHRSGLKALAGWSAVVDSDGIHTWDGKPLRPGEIVLLHWVPGLGAQLTRLLAVIRARRLNPTPLTPASFTGITLQRRSLDGD
jgi:peptidoglycan/xylan/chitin deacetylase (PgdA/CDA1 family)